MRDNDCVDEELPARDDLVIDRVACAGVVVDERTAPTPGPVIVVRT